MADSIWQTAEYRDLIKRRISSADLYLPNTGVIDMYGDGNESSLLFQGNGIDKSLVFGGQPLSAIFYTYYQTVFDVRFVTTINETSYTFNGSSISQCTYSSSSCSSSNLTFGDFIGKTAEITFFDADDEYADVVFDDAVGTLSYGVLRENGEYYWVDMGSFVVDDSKRTGITIWLSLCDFRSSFDFVHTGSISANRTLFELAQDACASSGIVLGTLLTELPNGGVVVTNSDSLLTTTPTMTDISLINYVAQATGTFAIIGRDNKLYFKWYEEVSPLYSIEKKHASSGQTIADYTVTVTGLSWTTVEGVKHTSGTTEYSLDVANNPLAFSDYDSLLTGISTNVIGFSYNPIDMRWIGDPALDVGDIIIVSDKKGNAFSMPVTTISNKNLLSQTITAVGESSRKNSSVSVSSSVSASIEDVRTIARYSDIIADRIKTGIVKSTDEKTYFNLDNDEIFMDGGANGKVKINPTVGIQMLDNTDVQIGGTASIGGLLASIAQIITNDPTDPECWATIGYTPPYHGIFVFRKSISTTVPAFSILLGTGGDFYLQNSSGVNIFEYQGAGRATILRDSAGKARFYADAGTTRLYDSSEGLRFYAAETSSRLYSPNNLNFVYVNNTDAYKSINGTVTTI